MSPVCPSQPFQENRSKQIIASVYIWMDVCCGEDVVSCCICEISTKSHFRMSLIILERGASFVLRGAVKNFLSSVGRKLFFKE